MQSTKCMQCISLHQLDTLIQSAKPKYFRQCMQCISSFIRPTKHTVADECKIKVQSTIKVHAVHMIRPTKSYLIFVVFFTRTKVLENKIYTEKTRKLQQNTQKIANFLCYYGKIHSKLPIFRVKSVKKPPLFHVKFVEKAIFLR